MSPDARADEQRRARDLADAKRLVADAQRQQQCHEALSALIARQARAHLTKASARAARPDGLARMLKAFDEPGLRSVRSFVDGKTLAVAARPVGNAGGRTFHFGVTSVSKTSVAVTAALTGRSVKGSASGHVQYLTREAALERAGQRVDRSPDLEQARTAHSNQLYIERAEPDGADARDVVTSFGNIPGSADDRARFWDRLEATESNPGLHKVRLDRGAGYDAFWSAVAARDVPGQEVPQVLRRAMASGRTQKSKLNEEELPDLIEFRRSLFAEFPSLSNYGGAIRISPARGGRVQTRVVGELPHDLSAEGRRAVLEEFCQPLAELGLRFWAVVHQPGKDNDAKNYHAHLAISDRPAALMRHPVTGLDAWDFEVLVEKRDAKRTRSFVREFQQPKIRKISERGWPREQRVRWASIVNQVCEREGLATRFDPRTYAEQKIDREPRARLSPQDYARERKGEVTEEGLTVARAEWLAHESLEALRFYEGFAEREIMQKDGLAVVGSLPATSPATRELEELAELGSDINRLTLESIADRIVAERLTSRVRLRAPRRRTEIDHALAAVARTILEEAARRDLQLEETRRGYMSQRDIFQQSVSARHAGMAAPDLDPITPQAAEVAATAAAAADATDRLLERIAKNLHGLSAAAKVKRLRNAAHRRRALRNNVDTDVATATPAPAATAAEIPAHVLGLLARYNSGEIPAPVMTGDAEQEQAPSSFGNGPRRPVIMPGIDMPGIDDHLATQPTVLPRAPHAPSIPVIDDTAPATQSHAAPTARPPATAATSDIVVDDPALERHTVSQGEEDADADLPKVPGGVLERRLPAMSDGDLKAGPGAIVVPEISDGSIPVTASPTPRTSRALDPPAPARIDAGQSTTPSAATASMSDAQPGNAATIMQPNERENPPADAKTAIVPKTGGTRLRNPLPPPMSDHGETRPLAPAKADRNTRGFIVIDPRHYTSEVQSRLAAYVIERERGIRGAATARLTQENEDELGEGVFRWSQALSSATPDWLLDNGQDPGGWRLNEPIVSDRDRRYAWEDICTNPDAKILFASFYAWRQEPTHQATRQRLRTIGKSFGWPIEEMLIEFDRRVSEDRPGSFTRLLRAPVLTPDKANEISRRAESVGRAGKEKPPGGVER